MAAVDPLDAHRDLNRKRKKGDINDRTFLIVKIFGVRILHIQLDSKNSLNSASKLNAIKHNANASLAIALMNFENLKHYDQALYDYPVCFDLLILLFWLWPFSLHCVIQFAKEFKINLFETVSEVSQKLKSWLK